MKKTQSGKLDVKAVHAYSVHMVVWLELRYKGYWHIQNKTVQMNIERDGASTARREIVSVIADQVLVNPASSVLYLPRHSIS